MACCGDNRSIFKGPMMAGMMQGNMRRCGEGRGGQGRACKPSRGTEAGLHHTD